MASGQLSTVVRHLHKFAGGAQADDASDAELLERFAARQDGAAFTALVKRHGPMVLAACRRVLGNHADADDAFQATFLVLVRKAATIRRRAALGGWLHEVALRVAMRARTRAHCRRRHEQRVPDMPRKDFLTTVVWRDLQPVLDEEVQGLPDSCREAFVLCYLEGKTYEQAAQQLDCPTGTISRRLARARELLRERLTRRGLVLPAGMLTVVLSQQTAPAAVPAVLIASTVKTALRSAAGAIPARVAALAEGGLQAMKATKTKVALALLLTAGLALAGAAVLARSAPAATTEPGPASGTAPRVAAPRQKAEPAKESEDAAKPTVVSGQVVGADDKPIAGAQVAVIGRAKLAPRAGHYQGPVKTLAEGKTDRDGKFRLTAPAVTRHAYWSLSLIARAPGHGLGHHTVGVERRAAEVKLKLPRERLLRGRLVDLQGLPAAGIKVQVANLPNVFAPWDPAPDSLKHWPGPATSDAGGRFTLRGLPSAGELTVVAEGGGFARQYLAVKNEGPADKEVALALAPGRVLEGTVTYHDTGKPVPNARLRILSMKGSLDLGIIREMQARADANGRYRVVPNDGGYFAIAAYPPAGEPYLMSNQEVDWPKAIVLKREVNLALRRGILVVGVVKESPSGKAVTGASVEFEPRYSNNPFFTREVQPRFSNLREVTTTGADGKFALVVLPGPGHLLINGPTPDYAHATILTRDLLGPDVRPNRRYYPDGLVALDLKPDAGTHRADVTLKRAVTLKGRVLGPDGKAVAGGHLFGRSYVASGYMLNPVNGLAVKDGRFELPGWDSADPAPVYFLCPELGLGGVLRLKGGPGDSGPTVRLQKTGGAKARILDERGKPLVNARVTITVPVSPGHSFFDGDLFNQKGPAADEAMLNNFDHKNFGELRTDAEGRLELRGLIPGARHWIIISRPTGGMVRVPADIDAISGKTLDLKDLTVNLN